MYPHEFTSTAITHAFKNFPEVHSELLEISVACLPIFWKPKRRLHKIACVNWEIVRKTLSGSRYIASVGSRLCSTEILCEQTRAQPCVRSNYEEIKEGKSNQKNPKLTFPSFSMVKILFVSKGICRIPFDCCQGNGSDYPARHFWHYFCTIRQWNHS